MSTAKRHHYLPEFYLKGFAPADKLWVFDCETEEFRPQSPKATGLEKNLNTYTTDSGEKRNIETELSVIEGTSAAAIRKLDAQKPIDDADKTALALLVSLFMVRVPAYDREIAELGDRLHKKWARELFGTEDKAKATMERVKPASDSKVTPKEMVDFVNREEYRAVPTQESMVKSRIPAADVLARKLLPRDWLFAYSPVGERLVTSDRPFTLVPPGDLELKTTFKGKPINTSDMILVPLSQRVCLIVNSSGHTGRHRLSKREARRLNLRVALNCDRFVIGPERELVVGVVKEAELDSTPREQRPGLIEQLSRRLTRR